MPIDCFNNKKICWKRNILKILFYLFDIEVFARSRILKGLGLADLNSENRKCSQKKEIHFRPNLSSVDFEIYFIFDT